MKLDAVGVTTSDMQKTVAFYSLLGFTFPEFKPEDPHVESIPENGSIRLMIDTVKLITEILGEKPTHSNHSTFALKYDSPEEVNEVAEKVKTAGYKMVKEPWDAFWGQRYCIVADPDGYMIDLFAAL